MSGAISKWAAIRLINLGVTANPISASSMAGAKSSAKESFPERSWTSNQVETKPGMVAD